MWDRNRVSAATVHRQWTHQPPRKQWSNSVDHCSSGLAWRWTMSPGWKQQPKVGNVWICIPLDPTTAATWSLRHAATIDCIAQVIHGNEAPLIVAAIDAEPNNVTRPKIASTKTYDTALPSVVLEHVACFWAWIVGAWRVFSFFKKPIKGFPYFLENQDALNPGGKSRNFPGLQSTSTFLDI